MTTNNNNIISFPAKNDFKPRWIPLPKSARYADSFDEFEISGDYLADLGIFNGDLLTCQTNFQIFNIEPCRSICILEINKVQFASRIEIDGDYMKIFTPLYGTQPAVFNTYEVEILAIAVEWRRAL